MRMDNVMNTVSKIRRRAPMSGLLLFFLIFTIIIAAGAVIGQTVLYLHLYDEAIGFYEAGTIVPTIFYIACTAITLIIALMCAFQRKNSLPTGVAVPGRITVFSSLLCGFFLASSIMLCLIYYLGGVYTNLSVMRILTICAALPAAIYFLYPIFNPHPKRTALISFGFFTVIWAGLYLMCRYFEMDMPIYSPRRVLNQIALLSIMLYFLFELRFLLGRAKPRMYAAFSFIAIICISLSAVPELILSVMGIRNTGNDSVFGIAQICILIYIITRAAEFCTFRADRVPMVFAVPEEHDNLFGIGDDDSDESAEEDDDSQYIDDKTEPSGEISDSGKNEETFESSDD